MAVSIVIVDDHDGFRSEARALLEEEGYVIVGEAADAASAVAVVRGTEPDAVLLDIQLPDGNGFELATTLGRLPRPPRVILISSRSARDYRTRLADVSAPFISKNDLSGTTLSAAIAGHR